MPIKKENRRKYPANWQELRQAVLKRANNCCEFCGIENHKMVERIRDVFDEDLQTVKTTSKMIKIVLTTAHLDQNPENNDLENLKSLCQKCHLSYDAKYNREKAKETRLQNGRR